MNAYYHENDGPDADWRDDPGPPEARDPRTGLTARDTEALRQVLNREFGALRLGDHADANIDSARSLLRNVARGDFR